MHERPVRLFAPIDFRTRFPALDGLRAVAIVAVFAEHYGGGAHGGAALNAINSLRQLGWLGVDLFFVLSGFLITGILYDTLSDSRYFQRFFARRSLRIFPIYYFVFALLLLLTPLAGYEWKTGHLLFLAYMGNFLGNYDFGYYTITAHSHPGMTASISHFWSLCVEEQFYLLWPLVVFLVRKRRNLLIAASSLAVLAIGLRVAMVLSLTPEIADRWIVRTLPFRMDSLLIGGILALALRGPHADRIQRSCKWLFLGCGVIAGLMIATSWYALATVGYTVIAIAFAGLIGTTLRHGSPAYRLFHLQPLRTLGKYSYGFYIYHLLFRWEWISLLAFLVRRLHSIAIAGILALAANFIVTFVVSKISYDYFESRLLRYKRHFEYDSEVNTHRHAFVTR